MVCATNKTNMTQSPVHQQQKEHQTMKCRQEDDDDFDMAMDEEDDSEEDSSQDDESSTRSSAPSTPTTTNKHPGTQALFLNFTSDLSPQKVSKKKSKPKKQTAYRVNGVNILNRNNLDSKTAIERIQRRRENHNHVERRRRDNINNTIFELSTVVPNAIQPGQKPNKGNILKLSLDYINNLQAENNALKERLAQYTSSRATSASPPPSTVAVINTDINNSPAVDEPFNNNQTNIQQQQQSPLAPNSPNGYMRNTTFTHQPPQSMSIPLSPLHTTSIMTVDTNLPTPLSLPPQQQQQLQNVFSTMSVSSNTSSATNTPVLSTTTTYPPYLLNNTYNTNQQIYIPQPPQLYTNEVFTTQPQQHKNGLRLLLPATKPLPPPAIQQNQSSFLPSLRMSGYEKIYGNVCRY